LPILACWTEKPTGLNSRGARLDGKVNFNSFKCVSNFNVHVDGTSFVTGVTYLKHLTVVAWRLLSGLTFSFSFGFNLNMEVLMNAHVDMFVAAALWSLVGKLQTTQ
jgi:hypothetical protein